MKYLFSLLFTITSLAATARQDPNEYFNSEAFWKHVKLEMPDAPLPRFLDRDTTLLVASNRNFYPQKLRFLGETSDSGIVRFFFLYTHNGDWHAKLIPSLKAAIKLLPEPNQDWLIYTEGMGKIFTSDIDRGIRVAGTYKLNIILLDYPSIRTDLGGFKNYKFAIHSAKVAYKDLLPVIDSMKELKLANKLGTGNITLFFHSMGNNVMRETILNGKLPLINNTAWADNLILNSACVPQKHHKDWLDQVHFAKHIYINYNPHDRTLKGAHLISFTKQLGEKVKKPISANATYINFHLIADDRHSNFATLLAHPPIIPRIISQYAIILHGRTLPVNDTKLYQPDTYKHIGWDMLPE
jgi:hypothetical protein